MSRKRQRLYFVVLGLLGFGAGTALVLTAFQDNIVFFRSPTDVAEGKVAGRERFRIGGLVEEGSLVKNGEDIAFSVTDLSKSMKVQYHGLLPDLFREGQGIVAEGRLDSAGVFVASEVVAKHDEKYMPREVADALKKSGRWNEGTEGGAMPKGMTPASTAPTSTEPAAPESQKEP